MDQSRQLAANQLGAQGFPGAQTPSHMRQQRSFAGAKLEISLSALKLVEPYWAGVAWVVRTIQQRQAGLGIDELDPDADSAGGGMSVRTHAFALYPIDTHAHPLLSVPS